jgi:hypothetical protein
VDDWEFLTLDERKALVADMFEEIRADQEGTEDILPREMWKPTRVPCCQARPKRYLLNRK